MMPKHDVTSGPAISAAEKGAASFTPGPWVANESMVSGRIRNAIFAGKHGNKILATARDPYGEDSEVAEANARLIAAAPAMAEALAHLLAVTDESDPQHDALLEAEADSAASQERSPSYSEMKKRAFESARAALSLAKGGATK